MPLSDKMLKELMITFQAELQEHLGMLTKDLLSLEQNPTSDERSNLIMNVFRAAHSIKGAARTVNLKDIEMIAHRMENTLVKIREGGLSLTPPLFDVLLSAVDAIGNIMAAHLRGEKIASDVIAAVLARLDETAAPTSEPTLSLDSNSSLVRPQAYTPPDPVDPNGEKSSPPNGIPS